MQTLGIKEIRRSIPFLYVILAIKTMLIVPIGFLLEGSAVNFDESIAFGITEYLLGSAAYLMTPFSRTAFETAIT